MNPERFEDLTKGLANATSRRAALKAIIGTVLVAFAGGAERVFGQAAQTQLKVTNSSGSAVQAYLTLGPVGGCVQDVRSVPWNITVTDTVRFLQGSFMLANGQSLTYTPPSGMCISGNVAFGTAPNNCPPPGFPNGINLAEFILNNSGQESGAQETIDDSGVDGVNADITFNLSGSPWNAGGDPDVQNITTIRNKGKTDNAGLVGVFPWGCDNCTTRTSPPACQSYTGPCQTRRICNVQRNAASSGGTVEIVLNAFISGAGQAPVNASNPTPSTPQANACGLLGQPCCTGNACTGSNTVCSSGMCLSCGGVRQVCCPGNLCQSGPCNNGTCMDPSAASCGAIGQPCCIPGNTCDDSGLACVSTLCVPKFG